MGGLVVGDEGEQVRCGDLPALGARLADGGQRNPGDCGDADVVVPDDRHLPRNRNPVLCQCVDDADGHVVVGYEEKGGLLFDPSFLDEGGDEVIPILLSLHQSIVDELFFLLDGVQEPLEAMFDRLVLKAGDDDGLFSFVIIDVQGGQAAALFVVTTDKGDGGVERDAVDDHERDVGLREQLHRPGPGFDGGEQHSIDSRSDEGLDEARLLFLDPLGGAEQHRVPVGREDAVDSLGDLDEEEV